MSSSEWETITADKYCTKVADGTHDTPKRSDFGKPLVTSKNIIGGRLNLENTYLISEEDYKEINKRSGVDQYDVLLSMIGTVGEACFIDVEPNFAIKNVGLLKTESKLKSLWLYYYLRSPKVQQLIRERLRGTTQQYLPLGEIRDLPINFPRREIKMERIISILSVLDEKIELNRQTNQTLEAIAQAIYKEWFVNFNFPGATGEMQDSELGPIPKGWRVGKLGDNVQTILGGTPSTGNKLFWENGTVGWINSGKTNEFRIIEPSALITEEAVARSNTKLLPKGTIVLAITGATLGQVSLLEINSCANQSVVGVLENEHWSSEYLYLWIKANIGEIIKNQSGGAQQHINKNDVNDSLFLMPDDAIVRIFTEKMREFFQSISLKCFETKTLMGIRDNLLPKLMSGEIEV